MTQAHTLRYYLRSGQSVEDKRPSHYLDTRTFKIYAPMPEAVSKHGRFSFKWTRTPKQSHKFGWTHWTEISTYVSMDDGISWLPIVNYGYRGKNHSHNEAYQTAYQIHDELLQIRAEFKRNRTNRLAKERRQRIKAKQEELDCSAKEARKIIAEEKRKEKASRATSADIKRTKRIMAVAPLVRDLKNEVDALLTQLQEDPRQVNITYVSRAKRNIQQTTRFLSSWNEGRRG